jgi:hypothetical protein
MDGRRARALHVFPLPRVTGASPQGQTPMHHAIALTSVMVDRAAPSQGCR